MPGNGIDAKTNRGEFDGGYDHESMGHDLGHATKDAQDILERAYGPYGAYHDVYTQQMLNRDQVPLSDIVEGELRHEMNLLDSDPDNPIFDGVVPEGYEEFRRQYYDSAFGPGSTLDILKAADQGLLPERYPHLDAAGALAIGALRFGFVVDSRTNHIDVQIGTAIKGLKVGFNDEDGFYIDKSFFGRLRMGELELRPEFGAYLANGDELFGAYVKGTAKVRLSQDSFVDLIAGGHLSVGIGGDYIDFRPEFSLQDMLATGRQAFFDIASELDDFEQDLRQRGPFAVPGLGSGLPGGPGGFPVVLDLAGDGITVTELQSSSAFFDLDGDGYRIRTAWAGAGDGVLAIDADGDGKITERKEIVFTDWDPGAKDDMAALRSVFDTNDDGVLDKYDDEFSKFRVIVTKTDGTTEVKTLENAGVLSIKLTTDSTEYALSDGSSINGMTIYDKVGGGTGKAAAVTFAAETQGYAVENSVATDGNGVTTVTNVGRTADGGIANVTVTKTSADGNDRTIKFDADGDGVFDQIQTIEKEIVAGVQIETITNHTGGGVLINETKTETSADGSTVTISSDTRGGGYYNEIETRVLSDGILTITLEKHNPDDSLISQTTTTTTKDGLSRTESYDLDGDETADLVVTEVTVVDIGDKSRTETYRTESQNGNLLSETITEIDPTGQDRTITTDADGDKDIDLKTIITVVNDDINDRTITTIIEENSDKSLRSQKITSISDDSLTYVTEIDLDGDGDFDVIREDTTVLDNGKRTQTVTDYNDEAMTSVRAQTTIVKHADGRSRDIAIDIDGDGRNEREEVIVVAQDDSSVDTLVTLSWDKSIVSKSITKTSADGLTVETELYLDADAKYDLFMKSVTVLDEDKNAIVTETIRNGDGTLRTETVTETSADGLTITVKMDRDGDESIDLTHSSVTDVYVDSSYKVATTDRAGNNALLASSVTTVSADRNTTSATRDLNGDGTTDQTQSVIREADGDLVDTVTNLNGNGGVITRSVTTTSANGLSVKIKADLDGDGTYDSAASDVTTLNADGSRTKVTIASAGSSQIAKTTQTVTGNGLTISTNIDANGDGTVDTRATDVSNLTEDGGRTRTLSTYNANDTLRGQSITKTSDDGLTVSLARDIDGDGVADLSSEDVTALNPDGSTKRTIVTSDTFGERDNSVTDTSADGRTITTVSLHAARTGAAMPTELGLIPVSTKEVYTRTIESDGRVVEMVENLGVGGALLNSTRKETSANGLTVTESVDQNGDGTDDVIRSTVTVLESDGSRVTTVSTTNASSLINKEVTIVSGNGLSTSLQTDRDGNGTNDLTTNTIRVLNQDGSVVDSVTEINADATQRSQVVTTTSADRKTATTTHVLNGVNRQTETRVLEADGDTVSTIVSKDAAGTVLSTVTTTTAANGLSKTIQTKNGAGTVIDTQATTTVLNADGSRTETATQAGVVSSTIVTNTSANGLTRTRQATLTGKIVSSTFTQDQTVLALDGSRTQTVEVHAGTTLAGALKDKAVITTSDDGLSVNTTLDVNGDGSVDNTLSSVTYADGSRKDTAIYNKLAGGLRRKEVTATSSDERLTTLERDTDGNGITDLTVVTVRNADGSVTETRVGAALGGVPAYSQVTTTQAMIDGGQQSTTEYFNGSGIRIGSSTAVLSANRLNETVSFDINGDNIFDKYSVKSLALNPDGSTTETETFIIVGGVPSSVRVTIRSADGLVTTTRLDLDGNGINEQSSVTTVALDGSLTHTFTTFDNLTGAQTSQKTVSISATGQSLANSSYQSVYAAIAADLQQGQFSQALAIVAQVDKPIAAVVDQYGPGGSAPVGAGIASGYQEMYGPAGTPVAGQGEWVFKVQTNNVLDTSTIFVGANGSNQWVRTISGTEVANATHVVDSNGVETWTWNIVNTTLWAQSSSMPIVAASGSIQIDAATRDLYVERANEIYSAALSRDMGADEREVLAQYITNGVLNETQLASHIVASAEFTSQYGTMTDAAFVVRLYLNAFGHLPSATLRDYYVNQLATSSMTRSAVLVAIGSSIESGLVTRSDWQNGTVNDTVSYSFAGAAVTVDLTTPANNQGDAKGDVYTLVREVIGSSYNDTLKGDTKANTLNGGAGADTLVGGAGNDVYVVDNVGDVVTENASEGYDSVVSFLSFTLGSNIEQLLLVDGGDLNGTGNALANYLIGNSSSNELNGQDGDDYLSGGAGNDTLNGGAGTDTAAYITATASVNIDLSSGIGTGGAGNDTLTGIENVTGSGFDDTLSGNSSANLIEGGGGNDYINGGSGNDKLYGGDGDDVLIGAGGADLLNGGTGKDTIDYSNAGGSVTVNLATGAVSGSDAAGDTLTSIENINGSANKDTLTGDAGDNQLNGLGGADTLTGGAGNDTYIVDDAGDSVVESASQGIDTVFSAVTFALAANVENLILTGSADNAATGNSADNILVGNEGNNTLSGGGGNDSLDGGAGNDKLFGGAGNDSYTVDTVDDVVTEYASEGTDTVVAKIDYALSANVENLVLQGSASNGTGNAIANAIYGTAGDNTLAGGDGDDWLAGAAGKDVLNGGSGNDWANYAYAATGLTASLTSAAKNTGEAAGDSYTSIENIYGSAFDDTLEGDSGANQIVGGAGNDILDGADGADTLAGGAGNDIYFVGIVGDIVTEGAAEGYDSVNSSIDYTLGANLEQLALTGSGAINGTGNALDNYLHGNAAANTLSGLNGDDYMSGGAGDDTLDGGAGNDTAVFATATAGVTVRLDLAIDTATGGAGNDTLVSIENIVGSNFTDDINGDTAVNVIDGGAGNDIINAMDGNDKVFGGDGDDVLTGSSGGDLLNGGAGRDTINYSNAGAGITVNLATGATSATGHAAGDTFVSIENINGSAYADNLTGDAGDNQLNGLGGVDTLTGGAGNDTYVVDVSTDTVVEASSQGTDTVLSAASFTLSANVENLVLTGNADITATGNTLDNVLVGNTGKNTLTGGGGNDSLDGAAGADTLVGGTGDDSYTVDNAGDVVTENANEGIDTVVSLINYTLGANLETLVLQGSAVSGTGNALANAIFGNAADNALSGGDGDDYLAGAGGNDSLNGGNGNDWAHYAYAAAGVTASLSNATSNTGEAKGDTYTSIENIYGSAFDDTLEGDAGANVFVGNGGADIFRGLGGNDTYSVDSSDDVVQENASEGTDLVQSTASYILGANVENLTLLGNTSINGTGSSGANSITGNSAANVLDGGAGADTLIGGAGDDTYVIDDAGDVVTENTSEGFDSVTSFVSYTLGANVELLSLAGTGNLTGSGNSLTNYIYGNSGANALNGQDGDDYLNGAGGADQLDGGAGSDWASYTNADTGVVASLINPGGNTGWAAGDTYKDIENLYGSSHGDTLRGDDYKNYINGSSGNDVIYATLGGDVLDGGDGIDTISYKYAAAGVYINLNSLKESYWSKDSVVGFENATGSDYFDYVYGDQGANRLDGGKGNDYLLGYAGDDTYVVDNALETVVEAANEGYDTVESSVSYTAPANIEKIVLTGSSDIDATGNTLNNAVLGNAGSNVLKGGGGEDCFFGGAGNDTYYVDSSGDVVQEAADQGLDWVYSSVSFALGENVDYLVLTGAGNIDGAGNNLTNSIQGTSGSNILRGFGGNDWLRGGAGADKLIGGDGFDWAAYDDATSGITVSLSNSASNTGIASGDTYEGIEWLYGSTYNDTLEGDAADNALNGSAGADTLKGLDGNDTYFVDNASDSVVEQANQGHDIVYSLISNTLGANVEDLTLTGSADLSGSGNSLDNAITGNSGANTLSGNDGSDVLAGGAGNDVLSGGLGADQYLFNRGDGSDQIVASATDAAADKLSVGGAVDNDQLWFSADGTDLVISVIGTNDHMTVKGWYASGNDQLDRIEVASGEYLLTSDVQALVNAMASLTPPPLGQTELSVQQQQTLAPVLASSWHQAA